MGVAARRYWIPATLSSDLPQPDCDPIRVELLGETFVAFRDTEGKIGFLDEACCHRGASLTLGRVEGCGIRCIYHGWKFAVDGTVMETPNVADPNFKTRFKARAYPTHEAGGLIWVYLGPAHQQPAFPRWRWFDIPASQRIVTVHVMECNFVQVLEGLVDSSHLGILHTNGLRATADSDLAYAVKVGTMQFDLAPRLQAEDTEFGFHYAALRSLPSEHGPVTEARVTAFVAPFTVVNANGDVVTIVVPANDERSRFFHVFWDTQRALGEEPLSSEHLAFVGLDAQSLAAYGISTRIANDSARPRYSNRFHQDRESMRAGNFSGMRGLIEEDVAVSVASGPLRDRSKERLTVADVAVSKLHRVLLGAARRAQESKDPIGINADVATIAGSNAILAPDQAWQSLAPGHRRERHDIAADSE